MFDGGAIKNDAINRNVVSIGFEFEFSGLRVELEDKDVNDALKESHNKLKVYLPDISEYHGMELHIGNDGPYKDDVYSLEFAVTFTKFNCINIINCYLRALKLLNTYINTNFYKIEGYPDLYNIDGIMTIEQYGKIICEPQCTIGVEYNNIKDMFIQMFSNSRGYNWIPVVQEYVDLFKSMFNLEGLDNIEETWIFLVSYYHLHVLANYHILLKESMHFFLRHGLISIMPTTLQETMSNIEFDNRHFKTQQKNIRFNNYLYYLYRTRDYNNENFILQYNNNLRELILKPHESHFFKVPSEITFNTILYFEYRSFTKESELRGLPDIIDQSASSVSSASSASSASSTPSVATPSVATPSVPSQLSCSQMRELYESISSDIIEKINFDSVDVFKDHDSVSYSYIQSKQYEFDIIYNEITGNIAELKNKTKIEKLINIINNPTIENKCGYLDDVYHILNPELRHKDDSPKASAVDNCDGSLEDVSPTASSTCPKCSKETHDESEKKQPGGYQNGWFHYCY